MRAKLYRFLSIFGYQPKLSDERGFVFVDSKEQFWRALRKYLLWMLLTAIAAGAAEFVAFIIAMEVMLYGGWGSEYLILQVIAAAALLAIPILTTFFVHIWMYKRLKLDDSRMSLWHCFIFFLISIVAVTPGLYLMYALFFG